MVENEFQSQLHIATTIEITWNNDYYWNRVENAFQTKKPGQIPRSRLRVKKCWYPWKGPFTGNTHVKYQSSSTHYLKVISKVKVSERRTEWQNDRHEKKQSPPPDYL